MYWNIYLANDENDVVQKWENLAPTEGMARMRSLQVTLPRHAKTLETAARGLFAGEDVSWSIDDDRVYVELHDRPGKYVDGTFVVDHEREARDGKAHNRYVPGQSRRIR